MLRYLMIVGSLAVVLAASPLYAGHSAGGCAQYDPCQVQYVQKTVYRPQLVTETRTVMVTEYTQEQREGTRTVYRCVPEQQEVQRSCTVMVREVRTKTVPVTYCKPVCRQVERQYAVQVPYMTPGGTSVHGHGAACRDPARRPPGLHVGGRGSDQDGLPRPRSLGSEDGPGAVLLRFAALPPQNLLRPLLRIGSHRMPAGLGAERGGRRGDRHRLPPTDG
jgi:hypothetical protein